MREVDALVALQPDEASAETGGKRSRRLRLAHPGLALEEEGLVDAHRDEDRRRQAPIAEVVVGGEEVDDRVDRRGLHGSARCVHDFSVTSPRPAGQAARRSTPAAITARRRRSPLP
jgi:hypothetical protein